jgi:hypothetical protein
MFSEAEQSEQEPGGDTAPAGNVADVEDTFESNPRLMLIEALMFAVIAIIGALLTYELAGPKQAVPAASAISVPGMLEAETLPVIEKAGDFMTMTQDTSTFAQGQWSGGKHLFAATRSRGDTLTMKLPAGSAGGYDLRAYLTKSFDYGIVQISVNGANAGSPIDLWSYVVESTGPVHLGRVTLQGDGDVVRIEVVGKNERAVAPFYQFGLDGFVLEPAP